MVTFLVFLMKLFLLLMMTLWVIALTAVLLGILRELYVVVWAYLKAKIR